MSSIYTTHFIMEYRREPFENKKVSVESSDLVVFKPLNIKKHLLKLVTRCKKGDLFGSKMI